jgi:cobalt-zinc-cadmium efflux system outer membrane protein
MASGSSGGLGRLEALFACGSLGGKTDAELLQLFASGEASEAAFEALVVRHGPDVLRACRRILSDPNDAEDAFQATFLVLARRAASGSIGRSDSLGPWLHGVALRVARKARVAAARRRKHEGRVAGRPVAGPAQADDLAIRLREEVERLPEPLRTPVVLCYLEDMTYQGAARRLEVSEGTIRGRLVKARTLLRLRLGRHEDAVTSGRPEGSASRGRPPRVPRALVATTIRSAMAMAPDGVGLPGLSATVAELMEGVLTMTLVTRWMLFGVALLTSCLAAAGGAALAAKGDGQPPIAERVDSKQEPPKVAVRPDESAADPHPADVLTLDLAIHRLLIRTREDPAWIEMPMARFDVLNAGFRAGPTVDVDSQFASFRDDSTRRPGGPTQYDINISDPLDYSLKRQVRTRRAGAAKTVTEAQYQDAVRNRIAGLHTMYVDAQKAQERPHEARANLAYWAGLLEEARGQGRRGAVPQDDVGQIESSRQLANWQLSEAKAALARAKRDLGLSLAFSVEESNRFEVERLRLTEQPIPPSDRLIHLALQARPDLAALRFGLTRAEGDLGEASKRPTRSEDAYVLYQPYTLQDNTRTDRESKTSFAMGVTVPLPVYNRKQGNIKRAEINLRPTQFQLAEKERAISQEVEGRHRECESIRAGYRGTLIRLQRHRRAFQEAERRYETGEGKAEDIVKARRDLEASQTQYLDLLARHRRGLLALNTGVGVRLFP